MPCAMQKTKPSSSLCLQALVFQHKVDPQAPGCRNYYDVIAHPMWLDKVSLPPDHGQVPIMKKHMSCSQPACKSVAY